MTKKINKAVIWCYLAACVVISAYAFFTEGRFSLSFVTPLFVTVPFFIEKLFKLTPNYPLNSRFYVFCLFAYGIGVVCGVYLKTDIYDKVIHCLSGALFADIGIYIYSILKGSDFKEDKTVNEWALCLCFSFFFALSTAAVWEIYEFTYDGLTGQDSQNVIKTGTKDTMLDMIFASVGALLFILFITYKYRRKKSANGKNTDSGR